MIIVVHLAPFYSNQEFLRMMSSHGAVGYGGHYLAKGLGAHVTCGENGEIKLHFGSVKPEAVTFDLVRVFITKLLKILCFTAFKTYSDRALPIKNR